LSRRRFAALVLLALLALGPAAPAAAAAPAEWVGRSNENAAVLLEVMARFAPEGAGRLGVSGLDEQILDLEPGIYERRREALGQALAELRGRLATEADPAVKQDLEILIQAAEDQRKGSELQRRLMLPYLSVTEAVFHGLRALLDDQVAPERRAAALVRLRKYAGMAPGSEPIAKLAEARIRERLADASLIGPYRLAVEKSRADDAAFTDGIAELFERYQLEGWQEPYAALRKQLAAYDAFVRKEILPRTRTDFRQPPELYAFGLEQVGVDMPVAELESRAQVAFQEIQNQMQALAPLVAREKGWTATGYRDVIRELKKKQLVGDAILAHYESRIRDLEEIIRKGNIVTLPQREMQFELASEAESAAIPAPNMRPPPLVGNTGERGTFVLPLRIPDGSGETKGFDDFTFEAVSWTLTAHEGRPGHELQFAAMVEKGVSIARTIFAMNSVNVEGWGLYAEAEAQPYQPLEGQLIALQFRLLRAARAVLDPGLQAGTISEAEAGRVLREDVVLSDAMSMQEVERYTFRAPGQATSYFVGYSRLLEIRGRAERSLGPAFDRKKFNDFILAQGALPPSLLRKAVVEEFIPAQRAAGAAAPAGDR
jgi:hypothetical protein